MTTLLCKRESCYNFPRNEWPGDCPLAVYGWVSMMEIGEGMIGNYQDLVNVFKRTREIYKEEGDMMNVRGVTHEDGLPGLREPTDNQALTRYNKHSRILGRDNVDEVTNELVMVREELNSIKQVVSQLNMAVAKFVEMGNKAVQQEAEIASMLDRCRMLLRDEYGKVAIARSREVLAAALPTRMEVPPGGPPTTFEEYREAWIALTGHDPGVKAGDRTPNLRGTSSDMATLKGELAKGLSPEIVNDLATSTAASSKWQFGHSIDSHELGVSVPAIANESTECGGVYVPSAVIDEVYGIFGKAKAKELIDDAAKNIASDEDLGEAIKAFDRGWSIAVEEIKETGFVCEDQLAEFIKGMKQADKDALYLMLHRDGCRIDVHAMEKFRKGK